MNIAEDHTYSQGEILVVEDNISDLKLMSEILKNANYKVRPANDGELALRSISSKLPDLILLDINLPDMSGINVCRQLKLNPATQDIPIIFISAMNETDLKVKALEEGGIDYITKPFQSSEVLARIRTHLKMRQLQQKIEAQTKELMAEIKERKRIEEELEKHQKELEKLIEERTAKLKESEEKYRLLFENANDGILIHDTKSQILAVNPMSCQLLGYDNSELISMKVSQVKTSDEAQRESELIDHLIENGHIKFETKLQRKDGLEIPIVVSARCINWNNEPAVMSIYHDITERKKSEEILRQRTEELETVLDAIPAFVWIGTDPECRFIKGNRYVNEFFHIMPEMNVSQTSFEEKKISFSITHLKPDGTKYQAKELPMQQSIALGQEVRDQEFSYLLPNGRQVFVLGNAVPLFDAKGRIRGSVGVFLDITEKKQAEIKQKELEAVNLRLQKAQSLGQMAGGIAHLFNNYLCAVSGNLELALEDLPEDSFVIGNIIEAMKAARLCSNVSVSMLTYLGQSIVKPELIDISEFCRSSLTHFQSSLHNNITIATDITDAQITVRANTAQIRQVLTHLINNASESIGNGKGTIKLSVKAISASNIDISKFYIVPDDYRFSSDIYACLEVTDTGCGISAENVCKLFDPFFTTKFAGRGLGLPIVLGIVKSWGGMVGVVSEKDHGSTFMVFLPLSDDNSIRQ
ncbi:MAG: PAS domain S-box protein [Desulfamplus sp.]|nr:PAS domain S-box protein [Desulfamplus sp.]